MREQSLVPYNKTALTLPVKLEPLSQGDYERLKVALPAYRYLLLCKVLRNTGLRETEVMRATADRFRTEGPHYLLLATRGKKRGASIYENVALHPELGMEVMAHIKGNGIRAGELVFQFSARQFQHVFRNAAISALGRPAHPHQLRSLYATTLIDGGVPVGVAAGLLGHSDERTTLKHYYALTLDKRSEIARRMSV